MVSWSRRGGLFAALLLASSLSLVSARQGNAATLTGMVLYTANSHGRVSLGPIWNTIGGDWVPNLYLSATGPAGPLVNSGNGASTAIAIPLTPGTHTFDLFAGGFIEAPDFFGVNLFFDNATDPGISIFGIPGTGLFAVDSSPFTPRLTSIPPFSGLLAAGAGTLSYANVSLTGFVLNEPNSTNRVWAFGSIPAGFKDFTGTMSLSVSPVPLPAGLPLLGSALGMVAVLGRRRKRRTPA